MIDIKSLPEDFQDAIKKIGPTVEIKTPEGATTLSTAAERTAEFSNLISNADEDLHALQDAVNILNQYEQHEFIIYLFNEVLDNYKNPAFIHERLAYHHKALQHHDTALEHLKAIITTVPFNDETEEQLSDTCSQFIQWAMQLEAYEDVLWAYKQLTNMKQPLDAEDLNNWAHSLQHTGQESEAEDKCVEAILLDSDYPISYLTLAEIAIDKGKLDAANKHIQSAKKAGAHEKWNEDAREIITTVIAKVEQAYNAAKPTGHNFG